MSIKNSNPESRNHDLVVQELEDEVLVYDLLKNKAFCLNKTSAVIWQNCNGQRTLDEIAEVCGKTLKANVTPEMIWVALEQFKKDNLLEKNTDDDTLFNGMSRREVIRKISVGSLIALPIVSSLIAPKAVQAQSMCVSPNRANGCPCTANTNCTSKCCAPAPNGCVAQNSLALGTACRTNCNCQNNCCGVNDTCATVGGTANNGACRVNCECASGNCMGGVCQP